MSAALLILGLTLAAGADQTDDPMIRWDCDKAGNRLIMEMVRPPVQHVNERETLLLTGAQNFEQCHVNGASWTLLVDIVEYDAGPCEPFPDTIVSLLRNDKLVVSKVNIGFNCYEQPVLSALRVTEPQDGLNPNLEVCAAPTFGAEGRCRPLSYRELNRPIDNGAIADRAKRP